MNNSELEAERREFEKQPNPNGVLDFTPAKWKTPSFYADDFTAIQFQGWLARSQALREEKAKRYDYCQHGSYYKSECKICTPPTHP